VLSRHGTLTSTFLVDQTAPFFTAFNTKLLSSSNYVTRRQSLKVRATHAAALTSCTSMLVLSARCTRLLPLRVQLLGELLLTPGNVEVMMRYINDVSHLILIMQLLRDASRSIQFEAFHIFKVFVANPSKPAAVVDILRKNADRLLRFLSDFQTDREDEEFANEKAVLCRVLRELL
jgi:calcium binding protein 39